MPVSAPPSVGGLMHLESGKELKVSPGGGSSVVMLGSTGIRKGIERPLSLPHEFRRRCHLESGKELKVGGRGRGAGRAGGGSGIRKGIERCYLLFLQMSDKKLAWNPERN